MGNRSLNLLPNHFPVIIKNLFASSIIQINSILSCTPNTSLVSTIIGHKIRSTFKTIKFQIPYFPFQSTMKTGRGNPIPFKRPILFFVWKQYMQSQIVIFRVAMAV
uniref:Uncharacterized protein n=1 Tax=Cucumis sativus TaxID=3659 RepID=A0A0A0KJ79_CUCSA